MKSILKFIAGVGYVSGLFWLERRRPLRRSKEDKVIRAGRNLAMASMGALVIQGMEAPLVQPLAGYIEKRRFGLLHHVRLSTFWRRLAGVALMDYTLYLWHVLAHRVRPLWRFHAVHHVDRDMDASTALRFHFGELILSVPFRVAQVAILGIDQKTLSLWQTFLSMSILFHHSNIRLPIKIERPLSRVIVTPRMHGIHHDSDANIASANWSSGLTIWDMLHGTYALDIPAKKVDVGVSGMNRPKQVFLRKLIALPFRTPRAVMAYFERGTVRHRKARAGGN